MTDRQEALRLSGFGRAPIKMEGGIANPDEFHWECDLNKCEECRMSYLKWKQDYMEQQEQLRRNKKHADGTTELVAVEYDSAQRAAEPVQEPVAWLTPKTVDSYMRPDLGYETCSKTDYAAFPVYTAPPQRKPLETKQLEQIMADCFAEKGVPKDWWDWRIKDFALAIERAHGIGGEK